MKIGDFFKKYNGIGVDFDGYYGFQCVDLYRKYCEEVLETDQQSPGVEGAYQIWTTYNKDDFDRIKNTPDGVPELGDVIIWDKSASLGYGHVAVFNYGDVNSFVSFDQNFPLGSTCHFQNHNYTGVMGWLRPKEMEFTDLQVTDQTKIDLGEPWEIMEVQAIRSTLNDQKGKIEALESALVEKEEYWQKEMESAKEKCEARLKKEEEKSKNLKIELEKCLLRKVDNLAWWELIPLTWKKIIKWAKGVIPR